MEKSIITPSKLPLAKIHPNVLLFFNLQHLMMFREIVSGTKIKPYGPSKKFNFTIEDKQFTAIGGMIGAPFAALILENAIESGAKNMITFGTAGSLDLEKHPIGEFRMAETGWDQTGISSDYSLEKEIDFESISDIETAAKIISINSFYRLTIEKLTQYRTAGINLIDMETVATNQIAKYYGIPIKSFLMVSDGIDDQNQWIQPEDYSKFLEITKSILSQLHQLLRNGI